MTDRVARLGRVKNSEKTNSNIVMGPGVKMIIAHRATNAPLTNIGLARREEHPKLYPGPMIPPARYLPPPFADNIFGKNVWRVKGVPSI